MKEEEAIVRALKLLNLPIKDPELSLTQRKVRHYLICLIAEIEHFDRILIELQKSPRKRRSISDE